MKDNFQTANGMDTLDIFGLMVVTILAWSKMEKDKVEENMFGQMAPLKKDSIIKVNFMGRQSL